MADTTPAANPGAEGKELLPVETTGAAPATESAGILPADHWASQVGG
jgi:hypothetical protein